MLRALGSYESLLAEIAPVRAEVDQSHAKYERGQRQGDAVFTRQWFYGLRYGRERRRATLHEVLCGAPQTRFCTAFML